MKTDQLLTVNFGGHALPIFHLTGMGNLTELWAIGNAYRLQRGLEPLDLRDWMRRPQTEEFVRVVEFNLGIENKDDSKDGNLPQLDFIENPNKNSGRVSTIKSPLIKTRKGRYGGTWAHLYILLDAATYLDAQLKFEVYETFISNKLLEWRDRSGNEFIALNIAIDAYIPGRDAKEGDERKTLYIKVANAIRAKVKPEDDNWNTASHAQLEQRTSYERRLIDLLKIGVVKDEEHLLEIIGKL